MKDPLFEINAFLSEPHLLQILVENLATGRNDSGRCYERMQIGWKAIETSSIECAATVDLDIRSADGAIKLPSDNLFLFTCSKMKGTGYFLTWIRSLS
jgi:hypothetical protein